MLDCKATVAAHVCVIVESRLRRQIVHINMPLSSSSIIWY